ncbi:pilus assembly protein CpaB [Rhodobacter aestuarii]|uniref:Pilus assembly protein CpaB n=1 Tax=Rhodobacter aestuarii TaxID=453582 RepID=A0A1N7N6G8_9RHOB|nr:MULTISPECIES: Flp pilus assembly protein CpaB [Rhodobacter]PTV96264.1 pilus assembly protein CpaB [Rhodobacter aestuarii]SIS93945.1 pilus assembly protein CpaB [Rhodobacter aestuarii]SOB93314.1 pilus assembly protein CpaB [Rhodobacter sp. JA431]
MRMVFALFLALGVALGGVAIYMAQQQMSRFQAERDYLAAAQANAPQLADVVVLRRPLKYGERFTMADLGVVKMQADRLPQGVFHKVSAPQDSPEAQIAAFFDGETRPRAALRSYEMYEPILAQKITPPGVDAGITANLAPNMRAFTIEVDVSSGVSGFLRPGDRVDVYWSGSVNDQPVTKLIDTNLKLIAIDQSADADRSEETQVARTVTAEVTPEQVAALTLAKSTGRLTLSLVGMQNTADLGTIEIDRNKLLGIQVQEAVQVEAARVCTIKTRRGTEVIETEIPCKD